MSGSSPFSADYFAARDRFRRASRSVDARLESCPIGTYPATTEELTIDVAVIGPEEPTRTILVTSGLHGSKGSSARQSRSRSWKVGCFGRSCLSVLSSLWYTLSILAGLLRSDASMKTTST